MERWSGLADPALDTRNAVAGKGKRKRRKRTTQAGTVRRINGKARERLQARSAGHRVLVDRLTIELNGRDDEPNGGLYGELRDLRKGADPGPHLRTSQAQWKSEVTR